MNALKFRNGRFRILQLSDIQEIAATNPDTVALIDALIKEAEPDLIVLTGDQIKGYGITMQKGDAKTNAALTLTNILAPVKESGIPFTAVFGNHDAFRDADADFQWSCYKLYDNFAGNNYDFDYLPVMSEKSDEEIFRVYTFDSGLKKNGRYSPVTDEIVNKYIAVRDNFYKKHNRYAPALAFQHIPPADIYECLREVPKGTKGAVEGANSFSGKYFTLPSYARSLRTFMGENAASPDEKGSQVKTLKEKGDVLGLFFGHDHNNSFVVEHGKLDLGYTQGLGFNIYGPGKKRGGRVFDIYEDSPDRYKTFTITAEDIEGFTLQKPLKEFMYTHSPSSVSVAMKWAKNGIIAAAVTGAAIGLGKFLYKKL